MRFRMKQKVISFTGRLIPEKGIKQLVSAVKKINISRTKKGQAPVYLMIAGDGILYQELIEMSRSVYHIDRTS